MSVNYDTLHAARFSSYAASLTTKPKSSDLASRINAGAWSIIESIKVTVLNFKSETTDLTLRAKQMNTSLLGLSLAVGCSAVMALAFLVAFVVNPATFPIGFPLMLGSLVIGGNLSVITAMKSSL